MAQNNTRDPELQPSLNRNQLHPTSASSYFTQASTSAGIGSLNQSTGAEGQNGRSVNYIHSYHHHHREQQQNIHDQNIVTSSTRNKQHQHRQQQQVQHPKDGKMTQPFSAASAAFTNNNNNDGWGDDWGDWGDNAMQQKGSTPMQQQPMGTNHYFQPQQQYPPAQQHAQLDQSNQNFMHNAATGPHQQMFQNYANPQAYPPQPQQQQYAQQQTAPINFFVQRPPSHPPASITPVQPSYNQTIADSFNTSAGDSWNWNVSDSQSTGNSLGMNPVEPQPQMQKLGQEQNYHQHLPPTAPSTNVAVTYPPPNASPNHFSLPGAGNNTQHPTASGKVQVPQLARLKNETLSPQWSIESQVSQTSSDRSIESGEIGESRSSNTVPSDDGSSGRQHPTQHVENCEIVDAFGQYPPRGDVPDKLDEALNSLSIKSEPQHGISAEERRQERESSFPPPPPSIATSATNNQQADGAAVLPPKSSSKTPPLPPPPTEVGPPPFSMAGGPPPTRSAVGNPFKRGLGQRTHISTPGLGIATQPPVSAPNPNFFYQPQTIVHQDVTNVENPTPENQEIPDSRVENVENLEVAPNNDRNQYLQTGHLSEEGYQASQPTSFNDQHQTDDHLPPPGLSRYVPGQQQSESNQQQAGHSFPEPPPGLARMIPGTDLENATDLSMERQVDGEVSDSASNSNNRPRALGPSTQPDHHHHHHHHREEEISDRNLYLVPGESDTHHNQQRVIPGVEDDRSTQGYIPPPQQQPAIDIPINEQQRELVMDGENPHDPPPHVEISRDEPIEGGNTLDEPTVATASSTGALETDTALTVEPPRKDPSNTSTADESDKDRSMFYSKGKPSRRDEDPLRRSTKSKSSRDRYDTEDSDYSDRERRRREREGSGGVDGQHRDRRRGEREKDKDRRKESGRDRERDRDRGYDYRERDRGNRYERDRDRYGGRGNKYDRDSRYETDGSKYETERSTRYDKDGDGSKRYMSREEYYRKREERGGAPPDDDRRYRKEKDRERGDRYRDERRKDDRYREGGVDKRRDRHDRRYDYDDYRTGSRNGTERDRDRDRVRDSRERDERKDPRDRKYPPASSAYNAQYGAAAASGYYDPYSYYTQHQQYYEQLRRTNPQAYAEWYRTYYSQIQAAQMQRDLLTSDGRESVHSGRSSANDKERLDNTDGSLRQDPSTMEVLEPERLTPRKFPEIHPIVSVSCGLLVTAKNRLTVNGTADLVKILSLGINEPTRKLFQSYPGPLMKERTHKKSVIEFCEEQLRIGPPYGNGQTLVKSRGNSINSLHSFGSNVNRGSFTLLWNYIILLLRQNGTFVGTDISELLMQNKIEFPFESAQTSVRSTNVSGRNSSLSATIERNKSRDADAEHPDDEVEDGSENVENAYREDLLDSLRGKKEPMSELEITDKFRSYLIYGNISDALEWATENNLWGHALFLASKVDSRQHANVMMKFANKLTLNDPLQTLYQLLSGRTPSAVTSVLDEKWGDWRPHLAMLMSNSSAKPELIKKSITTLGDSLYNRGDLYAAHFCYLLSDVSFGRFSDVKQESGSTITANTTVRLILLGSSHLQRNFREFSTNESIMMTEIYEYARSLNEERYSITELQYYKYLLACRMLDHGMQLKCLLYMEQLAEQIQSDPYRFDAEFIKKVYTLGDRLKYYDPVLEKALDESVDNHGQGNIYTNVEDPAWLRRLSAILSNYNSANASNHIQQSTYEGVQDYSNFNNYTGYSADQQKIQQPPQISQEQQAYGSDPSDINKEFSKINDQFSQLNRQYTEAYEPQQQQQHQTPSHAQYDHTMAAPSYDQGYDSINHSSLPEDQQQKQQQQQQLHPNQQDNAYDQQQSYGYGYESPAGQPNMFVPAPVTSQDQQQTNPYDYWNANAEVPKPSITMPNAISGRPGFEDEGNSGGSPQKGAPQAPNQSKASADPGKKPQPGKDVKAINNGQSNSGWFGGIWNKFSLKPKNQMILPDDKNPTIVWDPEKKRWINTDGDEGGEEAFKPPPKMADLMPSGPSPAQMQTPGPPIPAVPIAPATPNPVHTGGYGMAPSMNADPTVPGGAAGSQLSVTPTVPKAVEPIKVPTLQSNMFKMQRNRTLKKSYVDVFNPSGAAPSRPTESILAPTVPSMATPQGGFFVPGPAPATAAGQNNESAAEGAPQFYNPNQFAGGYQQQ